MPAWHGAMLGAIKGGLVAVPCPTMLRARDLAFRVRHSGARLVVADRECEAEIEEMRNQIGDIVPVLYLDEARHELATYMPVAPTEETTAGETALILYTSGTTKEPKGVVHTHAYTWAQRMQASALARRARARRRLVHGRHRLGEVDLERPPRARGRTAPRSSSTRAPSSPRSACRFSSGSA